MATDSGQQDNGSAALKPLTLKPFGSVEYCPKCGTSAAAAELYWVDTGTTEYMQRSCGGCRYAWGEQPLDAQS